MYLLAMKVLPMSFEARLRALEKAVKEWQNRRSCGPDAIVHCYQDDTPDMIEAVVKAKREGLFKRHGIRNARIMILKMYRNRADFLRSRTSNAEENSKPGSGMRSLEIEAPGEGSPSKEGLDGNDGNHYKPLV